MPLNGRHGFGAAALVAAVVVVALAPTGSAATWSARVSTSGSVLRAIAPTAGDGAVVVGLTESWSTGGSGDAWVLALDSAAAPRWQAVLGGAEHDEGVDVLGTRDGGVLLAGTTRSWGSGGTDAWLVRFDAAGAIAWQGAYGGPAEDVVRSIQPARDGGFLVAGASGHFGETPDATLVKVAADGTLAWAWPLATDGDPGVRFAQAVLELDDGYLLLGGDTRRDRRQDAWVARLDATGATDWAVRFGSRHDEYPVALVAAPGGGAFVVGWRHAAVLGEPGALPFAVLIEADGRVTWDLAFDPGAPNGDDRFADAVAAPPGVALVGTIESGGPAQRAWTLQLDETGSTHAERTWTGTGPAGFWWAAARDDGDLLWSGAALGSARGTAWLQRVHADGSHDDADCPASSPSASRVMPAGLVIEPATVTLRAPSATATTTSVATGPGFGVVTTDCLGADCPPPDCAVLVEPPAPCAGDEVTLSAVTRGAGPFTHEWDLDADGVPDAFGETVTWSWDEGTHAASLVAVDTCASGPQECTAIALVPVAARPRLTGASVRDLAACRHGLELSWDAPVFPGPTGGGVVNIYRSETSCDDALARPPIVVGLIATSWLDFLTPTPRPLHYVIEAEADDVTASCAPPGAHHGGIVRRVCLPPVTDAASVGPPRGVGATLRARHSAGTVRLVWPAARDLAADEHFHLLRAVARPTATFARVSPEGDRSREHVARLGEPLVFFDLRVSDDCEVQSADEFPPDRGAP